MKYGQITKDTAKGYDAGLGMAFFIVGPKQRIYEDDLRKEPGKVAEYAYDMLRKWKGKHISEMGR